MPRSRKVGLQKVTKYESPTEGDLLRMSRLINLDEVATAQELQFRLSEQLNTYREYRSDRSFENSLNAFLRGLYPRMVDKRLNDLLERMLASRKEEEGVQALQSQILERKRRDIEELSKMKALYPDYADYIDRRLSGDVPFVRIANIPPRLERFIVERVVRNEEARQRNQQVIERLIFEAAQKQQQAAAIAAGATPEEVGVVPEPVPEPVPEEYEVTGVPEVVIQPEPSPTPKRVGLPEKIGRFVKRLFKRG